MNNTKIVIIYILLFVLCSYYTFALIEPSYWKLYNDWLLYTGNVRIIGSLNVTGNFSSVNVNDYNVTGDMVVNGNLTASNIFQGANQVLDTTTKIGNTTEEIWNVVDNGTFLKSYTDTNETDRVNLIIGTYIITNYTSSKSYTDTQILTVDECSEITGCVDNAITDGNTNWDNVYEFINISQVYSLGYFYTESNLTSLLDNNYVLIGTNLGNTTEEIRRQFIGSNNITIDYTNGMISFNGSLITITDTNETNRVNTIIGTYIPNNYTASINYANAQDNMQNGSIKNWTYRLGYYYTESNLTALLDNNYMPITSTFGNETTRTNLIINTYIPNNITSTITTLNNNILNNYTKTLINLGTLNNSIKEWTYSQGYYSTETNLTNLLDNNYMPITSTFGNETTKVNLIIGTYIPNNYTASTSFATTADSNQNISLKNWVNTQGYFYSEANLTNLLDNNYMPITSTFGNETTRTNLIIGTYIPNNVTAIMTSIINANTSIKNYIPSLGYFYSESNLTNLLDNNYMDISKTFGNETIRTDLIINTYIPNNRTASATYTNNANASMKSYVDIQVATKIGNVLEDTTPQLGGTLDANGNNIEMDTNNKVCLDGATCNHYIFYNSSSVVII